MHSSSPTRLVSRTLSEPFRRSPRPRLLFRKNSVELLPGGQSALGKVEASAGLQSVVQSLLYGGINTILTVPCVYGYAQIIFRDPAFQDHLPDLSRLVLLSCAVHQLIFTLNSSLPFAIGQVQDAGLIFLSTMATAISAGTEANPETTIPTTLWLLCLGTAALGATVWAVGRFRLAQLVSYLPMPVVGGYLAFIGFFCLQAGLGMSANVNIAEPRDWLQLLSVDAALLCSPSVAFGVVLCLASRLDTTGVALPSILALMPLLFYAILLLTGDTLERAREAGWVSDTPVPPSNQEFWWVWRLFDPSKVQWTLMPAQLLTWISMVVVVSFSSCLDVCAIEMDMRKELDINSELRTVGLSNLISGLLGGFTGSYIFSQTIFTLRTKPDSRLVGIVVMVFETLLFVMPTPLMRVVPTFVFAATLMFIGFDLMTEWLFESWSKVSPPEACILLITFAVIVITNSLQGGIAVGIVCAMLNFVVAYSQSGAGTSASSNISKCRRDYRQREVLGKWQREGKGVVTLKLSGFLFFGSSVKLLSEVKVRCGHISSGRSLRDTHVSPRHAAVTNISNHLTPSHKDADANANEGAAATTRTVLGQIIGSHNDARPPHIDTGPQVCNYGTLQGIGSQERGRDGVSEMAPLIETARKDSTPAPSRLRSTSPGNVGFAPLLFVIDFSGVTGMDATAASNGLSRVIQHIRNAGYECVFAELRKDFEKLLRANHVITLDDRVFGNIDDAVRYCESELLISYGGVAFDNSPAQRELMGYGSFVERSQQYSPLSARTSRSSQDDGSFGMGQNGVVSITTLRQSLEQMSGAGPFLKNTGEGNRMSPEFCKAILKVVGRVLDHEVPPVKRETLIALCAKFDVVPLVRYEELLYRIGDSAEYLYLILEGEVTLYARGQFVIRRERRRTFVARVKAGSFFGDSDFFLSEPRKLDAMVTSKDAVICRLSRAALVALTTEEPELSLALHRCFVKELSLDLAMDYQ